jgi:formylglycine-generating enzyme required for sulfatase activity
MLCLLALNACEMRNEGDTLPRSTEGGIEMFLVPAGEFLMGSPDGESGREAPEVLHRVRLTRPFYLGVTEVTQKQWRTVMNANPSHFTACGDDCPVERVSFHDIDAFLSKLNASTRASFRLPTEAEWEYACRAGGRAPFGNRSTLAGTDANINGRYPYQAAAASDESKGTLPVGRFKANAWGFLDTSGNVWEWTQDAYCPYTQAEATDPLGRCDSPFRVIRGGSWKFDANSARCALRYTHRPQDLGFSLGFRLARDPR